MVDNIVTHNSFLVHCDLCQFSLVSTDNPPCKNCAKGGARSGTCYFIPVPIERLHKLVDCAYESLIEKIKPNVIPGDSNG